MKLSWCSCGHLAEDHPRFVASKNGSPCSHKVWKGRLGDDLQPCPCTGFQSVK